MAFLKPLVALKLATGSSVDFEEAAFSCQEAEPSLPRSSKSLLLSKDE